MRPSFMIMSMVLCVTGAGCASSPPASSPTTQTPMESASSAGRDLKGTCVAMFERERVCTDVFIPALVDARVRLDVPAGIALAAQTEGRDKLVGKAKEEWVNDSKPEAIEATCTGIVANMPPEHGEKMQKAAGDCLTRSACPDFVACIIPLLEMTMRK